MLWSCMLRIKLPYIPLLQLYTRLIDSFALNRKIQLKLLVMLSDILSRSFPPLADPLLWYRHPPYNPIPLLPCFLSFFSNVLSLTSCHFLQVVPQIGTLPHLFILQPVYKGTPGTPTSSLTTREKLTPLTKPYNQPSSHTTDP